MRLIDADALLKELNDLFEWCRDSRSAGLDQAMCMIHEQPTVNQWIPVSERLPNDNKRVLVSIKMDGDEWVDVDCIARYGGTLAEPWNNYPAYTVVAWMPLPEPYKESEEE